MKNVKKEKYNIAVAGATGMVGQEFLKILEERDFPVGRLTLLASKKSVGKTLDFKGEELSVTDLHGESFEEVDIGLFSPGASVSAVYAPKAAAAGCIVIDNTSQFRMDPEVPLVVPEVNPEAIPLYRAKNIIANPNCSTIQLVVALKPLHDRFGIKRVVVSTYQAVSGAGREAMDELSAEVRGLFNMQPVKQNIFPHQIAFNCLPHIDLFLPDGSTKEERKMVDETKKILGDDNIRVTATTVRVPVFVGHSEAVNIEMEKEASPEEVREVLEGAPGVVVADDPSKNLYPTAVDASERDEVFVGRIRRDPTVDHGVNIWVVSDNLRKGAALNAVQIAEILVRDFI